MIPPRAAAIARAGIVPATLLLVALLATTAAAQDAAPPAPEPAWRTVVDPEAGFALRLPPSHDLARGGGGVWYVHGWLEDAEPLVPDVSIELLRGVAPEEAVASFPDGTEATPVELGPATRGLLVTARYEAMDGTPYTSTTYLAEAPQGTFRIDPYEGFVWEPFDAVARSFHLVELVEEMPGDP